MPSFPFLSALGTLARLPRRTGLNPVTPVTRRDPLASIYETLGLPPLEPDVEPPVQPTRAPIVEPFQPRDPLASIFETLAETEPEPVKRTPSIAPPPVITQPRDSRAVLSRASSIGPADPAPPMPARPALFRPTALVAPRSDANLPVDAPATPKPTIPLAQIRPPAPGEVAYFKAHADTPAMATEDNFVTFNPFVTMSDEDRTALRLNESVRIAMGRQQYAPTSSLTAAQRKTIKGWGGAYASDESLARQTVVARILSGDDSLAPYSSEQQKEAEAFAKTFESRAAAAMRTALDTGPSKLFVNPLEQPAPATQLGDRQFPKGAHAGGTTTDSRGARYVGPEELASDEWMATEGPDIKRGAAFAGSVSRGVDIAQQMAYGGVEAAGEAAGAETLTQWGREGRRRNTAQIANAPAKLQFTDIKSFSDFAAYAQDTIGEQIPIMGPMMAGGAAGALIGSVAPGIGTTIGGVLGAFAPGLVMSTGEVQAAIKEIDENAVAPGWAFAGGSAVAALDSVVPGKLGAALIRKLGQATAEEVVARALLKPAAKGIVRRTVEGGAESMATEGVTEAIQEAIGAAAAARATGTKMNLAQVKTQMIEAGAAGALMGLVSGGATGAVPERQLAPPLASGTPITPQARDPLAKILETLAEPSSALPGGTQSRLRAMGAPEAEIARMSMAEADARFAGRPTEAPLPPAELEAAQRLSGAGGISIGPEVTGADARREAAARAAEEALYEGSKADLERAAAGFQQTSPAAQENARMTTEAATRDPLAEINETLGIAPAPTPAPPTATFAFVQPGMDPGAPGLKLYNVTGGPLDQSTVSAETLQKHGIAVPPDGPPMAKPTPQRDPLAAINETLGIAPVAVTREAQKREWSSTQVELPAPDAAAIRALGQRIPDADLAEDSREDKPHVTVKYGLHTTDVTKVQKLLADEGPIAVTLGKTSIFSAKETGSDYDVVKVDIDSPDLRRLNKKIADALEVTDTHPTYQPHATVAYVKAGTGAQYAGDASLEGRTITLDAITFASKDGENVSIPLTGQAPAPAAGPAAPVAPAVAGAAKPWKQMTDEEKAASLMAEIEAEDRAAEVAKPSAAPAVGQREIPDDYYNQIRAVLEGSDLNARRPLLEALFPDYATATPDESNDFHTGIWGELHQPDRFGAARVPETNLSQRIRTAWDEGRLPQPAVTGRQGKPAVAATSAEQPAAPPVAVATEPVAPVATSAELPKEKYHATQRGVAYEDMTEQDLRELLDEGVRDEPSLAATELKRREVIAHGAPTRPKSDKPARVGSQSKVPAAPTPAPTEYRHPETGASYNRQEAQATFKKFKTRLTRAVNAKNWDAVIAEHKAFTEYYDASNEPYPDDWSRWERAADDARIQLEREKRTEIGKPLAAKPREAAKRDTDAMEAPYSTASMRQAFNLTEAQAEAADALVQAMGLDTTDLRVVKGGTPGDGALYDPIYQGAKGAVEFAVDGKTILRGLEAADISTGIHEIAHVARRQLINRNVPADQRQGITLDDIEAAEAWAGAEDGVWTVKAEEKFARGYERYLRDGFSPTDRLIKIFDALSRWLREVYVQITGSAVDVTISPAMREVFDALSMRTEHVKEGRQVWAESENVATYEFTVKDKSDPISQLEGFLGAVDEHPSYLRSIPAAQLQGHLDDIAQIREQIAEARTEREQTTAEKDLGGLDDARGSLDRAEPLIERELRHREGQADLFAIPGQEQERAIQIESAGKGRVQRQTRTQDEGQGRGVGEGNAQPEEAAGARQAEEEVSPERTALIERILAAAREPKPDIVPSGGGYAIRASNGTTVGQREATAEAVLERWQIAQDAKEADFRSRLEEMPEARLQSQGAYWLKEKAPEPPKAATGASVTYNQALSGVEIKFAAKPPAEVIASVKAAGFRWSGKSKVWYRKVKASEKGRALAAAQELVGTPAPEAKAEQPAKTTTIDAADASKLRARLRNVQHTMRGENLRYEKMLTDKVTESGRARTLELIHALERDEVEITAKLTAAGAMPEMEPAEETATFKVGDRATSYEGTGEIVQIREPEDLSGYAVARMILDDSKTYSKWTNLTSLEAAPKTAEAQVGRRVSKAPEKAPSATDNTGWLYDLSDQQRERVFAEMRHIDARAQTHQEKADALQSPYGTIGVGMADVAEFQQAGAFREFAQALRTGATPAEAATQAKALAREIAEKANAKRPKDIHSHVPADAASPAIDQFARTMTQVVKDTTPAPASVAETTTAAKGPAERPEPPAVAWEGPRPGTAPYDQALQAAEDLTTKEEAARAAYDKARADRDKRGRGTKAREGAEHKADALRNKLEAVTQVAGPARDVAYGLRLQQALADPKTAWDQRWAIAAKIAEQRHERLPQSAYDVLKAEAERHLKGLGATEEEARVESLDLANTGMSFPLSDTYTFRNALPRTWSRILDQRDRGEATTKLKALENKYGIQNTKHTRAVANATTPDERERALQVAEDEFKSDHAANVAADKAKKKAEAERQATEITRARELQTAGKLVWRALGTKTNARWHAVEGKAVTISNAPAGTTWSIFNDGPGKGWVVVEDSTGMSAASAGDQVFRSQQAVIDSTVAMLDRVGPEKAAEIITQARKATPPKPDIGTVATSAPAKAEKPAAKVKPPEQVARKAERAKLEAENKDLIAKLKAALKAPDVLLQHDEAPAPTPGRINPSALLLTVKLLGNYVKMGIVDFPEAVRRFQEDYGEGARDLDRYFSLAWQREFGGEKLSVADALAETPPVDEKTLRPLTLQVFDYLNGLGMSDIPKNPMTLRKQVAEALGVPVKQLEDDIDALNDAVEAVWAGNLRATLNGLPGDDLTAQVEAARAVESTLPRGHRTLEKSALQQFSTPLPISVLAAAATQAKAEDFVLEPTAGTGNLLAGVRPTEYGGPVEILAVELSPRRADLLTESGYNVAQSDYLHYPFTDKHRPTVILTNPPWGKYSTGKYGRGVALGFAPSDVAERFVSKNLRDLAESGRLVAVMPTTMLEATSFKKWLKDGYTVRAIIKSPAGSYDTRGTTIESVLLVVDKIGASGTLPAVIDATSWEAYTEAVEAIHARSDTTEGRATDAPRPDPRPGPGGRGGGRGIGGRRGGRRNAPVGEGRGPELVADDEDKGGRPPLDPDRTPDGPAAEPEGKPPALLPGPSDDLRADAAASGYFAPYTRRSALRGQPHPKLLVEARQLAGVQYPPLTITLTPSMQRAVTAGRVSVEQAEQALAALQANSGDKPFGYLAADAVGVGKSREIAMTILGAMDRAKAAGRPLRLMLTTKSRDNVEDLMDEIHFVASGKTAAQGGSVPFEVHRLADDYPGARKTGNEYEPLPKNVTRAVYVVDSYNVAKYRQALVDVGLHGIVGDEVQRFTNAEAQIGGAWVNLHARIMRGVPRGEQFFAYFTATPAQKVEDYAYLYGLRLWPIDGFNEWIDLVTGSMNEDQAQKLADATEAGTIGNIDTVITSTGADPVVGGDADGPHQGGATRRPAWGVGGSSVFAQRLTPAEAEQIPREWKMLGRFSARDLWRAGTTFEIHEFALTQAQTKTYNQFADLAVDIITMAQKYGLYDKSGRASAFGVTGMLQFAAKRIQMQPALEEAIRLAKKFQAEGYQPVLSIINVSEMTAERGHLLAAIEKINTRVIDVDPNDPHGGNVDQGEIPEAVIDRARLLDRVRDLGAFADPVEMIADALGQDKVAFIIGKEKSTRRKASLEFQGGARPFAVISGAGATGINLDQVVRTAVGPGYGKRVFLDVQYEWSAMEGLQRYGRVDRASSIAPPRLVAITSGNAAEKKFLATIANRMAALGALSKGGAESTGAAGNALAEFEITGDDALAAARRAYGESSDATKRSFATIKSAFRDPNRNGSNPERADFDPYKPKRDATGASMQDFQLPLLLMPTLEANAFWTQFIKYRDELRLESGEHELMRSTRFKGEILATTTLKDNLTIYTVQNEEHHRFGILVGLITPEMPRLRTLMAGARHEDAETTITADGWQSQTNTADLGSRRRYVTFTTPDTILAGLQIPFTRIARIAENYGASAQRAELKTADQVRAYLRAGETIDLTVMNPDSGKPWRLRMRRADERLVIENARMADRVLLGAHGATHSPVGNYWHVVDLEKFLERWPVPEQMAPKSPAGPSGNASVGDFTEDEPTRDATVQLRSIEFPEMVELAKELIGTPEVVDKFRRAEKRGEFRGQQGFRSGVIRLASDLFTKGQEVQLAATLAHEIGHLVDWLPTYTLKRGNLLGRLRTLQIFLKGKYTASDGITVENKEIRGELLALSNKWRPWDETSASASFRAYRRSAKELYADAISVLLNSPGLLEAEAPTFFEEFFAELDQKPDVKRAYSDLQEQLAGTREELIARRRARVQAGALAGEEKALDAHRAKQTEREAQRGSAWFNLRTEYYDKNTPINDLVAAAKKRGVTVPEDEDPRYYLKDRNYVGGKMKAAAEEYVQPIRLALEAAGIPWMTFHESLMYDRIVSGDRSEYANPEGLAPNSAKELLAAVEDSLSPAQNAVLAKAKKGLRAWVKNVSREAHAVGLLTDEMMAQIDANEAYAPYRVVEHIEDTVSWRIYKQKGTLKSISNTADAAILKTMATIRAIERQKMLTAVFDFMGQHAKTDITQAEERWNGRSQVPVDPPPQSNTELVYYYEQGKLRGKIVDTFVANSLNNLSVGQNLTIVRALGFVNSHWFRPVFTTFNLAFQTKNFSRDLLRTWANRPDTTLKTILTSPATIARFYAKGIPLARARAFGPKATPSLSRRQATADLLEAEKAGILGLTWNDMMRGRDVADTEIEQILGKVGIGPAVPKPFTHGLIATPLAGATRVLRFIEEVGNFIETLPKAAAIYEYKGDGSIANISPAQRAYIREKIGSPDFRAGGTHTPFSNNLLLFSNAFIQGTVSDLQVATNQNGPGARGPGGHGYGPGVGPNGPRTAFGFWWKTAMLNIAPKIAMFAAMYLTGAGGDDEDEWLSEWRRMLRAISEYDMTNYLSIPMGIDAHGNVTYVRLQQSDSGRLLGGLTWKALQFARGDKDAMTSAAQILEYTAGQTPGFAPELEVVSDVAQFVTGGKVYDPFRDRFLFTDDEARDLNRGRKLKKFIGYEFQNLGGAIVWKFYPGELRPETQTVGQKILELPIVSSVVGGWVKVGSAGTSEKLRTAGAAVQGEESTRRLNERAAVNDAIRQFEQLPAGAQTLATQRQIAGQLMRDLYGDVQQTAEERKDTTARLTKKLKFGVIRSGADPLVDAVLSATSNEQKAALVLHARESMSAAEYRTWMRVAAQEKVLSPTAIALIRNRQTVR